MPILTSTSSRGPGAPHTIATPGQDTMSVTDRARDDQLAALAHELRLPLSHIKGFVSSLRRTDVQWDEATRRDFLRELEIETDRLAELLNQSQGGIRRTI